jgi:hypothetical protein
MKDRVIQFVLSSLPETEAQRVDCLSDSIVDTLLPSLAEAANVSNAELAAKTLMDLAYIVGFTHRAEHTVSLLAAISEAMRSGMDDYAQELSQSPDGADIDDFENDNHCAQANARIH